MMSRASFGIPKPWAGRRSPSTLAAANEPPMKHAEIAEACSICSLYAARVCSGRLGRALSILTALLFTGRVFLHLLHPGPRIRLESREDRF
jgi:hypothetical protein